jgi:putative redox protein
MQIETKASASIGALNYRVKIRAGENTVYGDEPADKGGGGSGMNPYELLLASLGACTVTTLRIYSERKGMELGEIGVELHLNSENAITRITRTLRYSGKPTDEQKIRLIQIADLCPVHKILTGSISVETN